MNTRGTTMRQVALMSFGPDEADAMAELDTLWVQTMDLKHENALVYPLDIMVEHIGEIYPMKYIDTENCIRYEAENGSQWLISKSLQIDDVDAFFQLYLHLDEEEAAA
ncbi:MAG: hypothetical protein AB7U44_06945 [Sulfuricurvum sp.]|uniref:hypothetical protein n=1 Tax=Sulfuricurvum sp. TaxID=2025608 RepID=UPI00262F7082|nr:hypothetical protein [Sulfuricurvum sp.]MDD3595823.1 hypothetical protein [Sulfuricurvum sp.]MDD4883827.1 hypothetical protein [Sulfuricurvum sp.]